MCMHAGSLMHQPQHIYMQSVHSVITHDPDLTLQLNAKMTIIMQIYIIIIQVRLASIPGRAFAFITVRRTTRYRPGTI